MIFPESWEINYLCPMHWLYAPNIQTTHGFSTRHGGVSQPPYDSLNLGGQEDDPSNIAQNRRLALAGLGIDLQMVANLRQVHGCDVVLARPGAQTGDALVSNEKNIALAISVADCYPLLFHDPVNGVIGAAHAGWRGTVAGIAANTIREMQHLGAVTGNIQAAIGQGISRENFEVGEEVLQEFRDKGFPETCISGHYIDLLQANRYVMENEGIRPDHIWSMNRCTTEADFFSYRRDKGRTGRMWAVIML